MWYMLEWLPFSYTFWLPWYKSDVVFKGNHILCRQIIGVPDTVSVICWYIKLWDWDWLFSLHPQLWLQGDRSTPVCSWWMVTFWWFFDVNHPASPLMWPGGAMVLIEAGAVPDLIMGSGRWNLQVWMCYIRNLLHALILTRLNHFDKVPPPVFA